MIWRRATLAALVLVAIGMQLPSWEWIVEDAAISFAYARNWAEGWGLVPYPGRERVEGYSNPLWVAVLALAELVGVDSFTAARWLGLLLGASVVPAVAAVGRRVRAPLLAASVAATSAALALWSQSGLENPLLLALLAFGTWRLVAEVEGGGRPWSALIFAGVALTRPEGIPYAFIAGGVFALAERAAGRSIRRSVAWFGLLLAPVALFEALRYWYFALPLPATYYAKLGKLPSRFSAWDVRGWRQIREWFLQTGAGPLLPVVFLGLTGARGWRLGVTLGSCIVMALAIGIPWVVEPVWWDDVRMGTFGMVVVALCVATLGREGWPARLVSLGFALFTIAFTVRSEGDWMRGHRFLSPLVVPTAVLLGAGLGELGRALRPSRTDRAWGLRSIGVVGAALAVWVTANVAIRWEPDHSVSPWSVRRRLQHYERAFRRLELDRPFLVVDHDMGAMLWWHQPAVGRVIDARGLVDLPFALHQQQRPFVAEYLFERQTFDLAHAHASTGKAVNRVPRFEREYVEIEGYGAFGREHMGNFVRRDLFLRPSWDGPRFEEPVGDVPPADHARPRILGVRVPSPEVGPSSGLFLEIAVEAREEFRMVAFLAGADGSLTSWDLEPAYGWVPPSEWRPGEIFVGRYSLPIPEDVPLGEHDLGFVLFSATGEVLAANHVVQATDAAPDEPDANHVVPRPPTRMAEGELLLPGAVTIVTRDEMVALAAADRQEAIEHAEADRCEAAEEAWERALRHRTRSRGWQRKNRPGVARRLAACWARAAEAVADPIEQARRLERGRRWDVRAPYLVAAGQTLADAVWPAALEAREAGDHERAFALFEAIVGLDPSEAWARRYAEEARAARLDLKLGLGVDGADEQPED